MLVSGRVHSFVTYFIQGYCRMMFFLMAKCLVLRTEWLRIIKTIGIMECIYTLFGLI